VKYNVRVLSRAQRDVDSILDWIINERHAVAVDRGDYVSNRHGRARRLADRDGFDHRRSAGLNPVFDDGHGSRLRPIGSCNFSWPFRNRSAIAVLPAPPNADQSTNASPAGVRRLEAYATAAPPVANLVELRPVLPVASTR
jgi:hypothetical protein